MKVLHEIINFDARSKPGVVIIRIRATALQDDGTPYQWEHVQRRWVGEMKRVKKKVPKPMFVETKKGGPKTLEYVEVEVEVDERVGKDIEERELRPVTAEIEVAEPYTFNPAIALPALAKEILGRRRFAGKSVKDYLAEKLSSRLGALGLLPPDPALPKIDAPLVFDL